jgi:hypothetical protein
MIRRRRRMTIQSMPHRRRRLVQCQVYYSRRLLHHTLTFLPLPQSCQRRRRRHKLNSQRNKNYCHQPRRRRRQSNQSRPVWSKACLPWLKNHPILHLVYHSHSYWLDLP